jgi:hypothetical protein
MFHYLVIIAEDIASASASDSRQTSLTDHQAFITSDSPRLASLGDRTNHELRRTERLCRDSPAIIRLHRWAVLEHEGNSADLLDSTNGSSLNGDTLPRDSPSFVTSPGPVNIQGSSLLDYLLLNTPAVAVVSGGGTLGTY